LGRGENILNIINNNSENFRESKIAAGGRGRLSPPPWPLSCRPGYTLKDGSVQYRIKAIRALFPQK